MPIRCRHPWVSVGRWSFAIFSGCGQSHQGTEKVSKSPPAGKTTTGRPTGRPGPPYSTPAGFWPTITFHNRSRVRYSQVDPSIRSLVGRGFTAIVHQADAHRPDHQLLPGLESQLPLDGGDGIAHRQPAVVPYLTDLLIGQTPGKQSQDLPLPVRQGLQQPRASVSRWAPHRPGQSPGRAPRNAELAFRATSRSVARSCSLPEYF